MHKRTKNSVFAFQLLGVTMEFCEKLIDHFEPSREAREYCYMTVDGILWFLL